MHLKKNPEMKIYFRLRDSKIKALGEVACISQPLHKNVQKKIYWACTSVGVRAFGTSKFSVQMSEIVKGESTNKRFL